MTCYLGMNLIIKNCHTWTMKDTFRDPLAAPLDQHFIHHLFCDWWHYDILILLAPIVTTQDARNFPQVS